jgi:hypothetical protein
MACPIQQLKRHRNLLLIIVKRVIPADRSQFAEATNAADTAPFLVRSPTHGKVVV